MAKGAAFFDGGANFGPCSFGLLSRVDVERADYHLFEANPCRADRREMSWSVLSGGVKWNYARFHSVNAKTAF
jgi:hypothetical protein